MKKLLPLAIALACACMYVGCSCDCEVCCDDPTGLVGNFCETEEDMDKDECEVTETVLGITCEGKCK